MAPLIPFTPRWLAARDRSRRARAYVLAAFAEPDADDVTWLAGAGAAGDDDHARWELRYARLAIAVLVAERDALDDRTGAEVVAAMRAAFAADDRVAPDLRPLAERQLSERLQTYRDAFLARGASGAGERMARVLLSFASDGARSAGSPLARATRVLSGYVDAANAALVAAYGPASLPDHLPPSEVAGRG
ncbi:MAG: hypothetical protein U9Q74_13175 [Gemmatimonadota bacterium]|nr:hypothetical protein [Gemmatimonadota bacterium]